MQAATRAASAVLISSLVISVAAAAAVGSRPIVRTRKVGLNPVAVAVDGLVGRAFILNRGRLSPTTGNPTGPGSVTVLDISTGAVLGTVRVGIDPNSIAVDERTQRVFVVSGGRYAPTGVHSGTGTVTTLDARSGRVVATTVVGVSPSAIADDEVAGRVVVANSGTPPTPGSVSVLEASRGRLLKNVRAGVYPAAVAVDSPAGFAFVANLVSNTIIALDLRRERVRRVIRLGTSPGTLARLVVDPRTDRIFALSFPRRLAGGPAPTTGYIHIVDATVGQVLRVVPVANPTSVALDSHTGRVLVTSDTTPTGRLTALNAKSGATVWSRRVGRNPTALAVDAPAGRVVVLNQESDTVSILSPGSGQFHCVISVGKQGKNPTSLAVDSSSHQVIVVNPAGNSVTILTHIC
jgi:DNA-binding beta-propeller fold protein YncE